jgi:CBS domain-containing protein
MWVQDIMSRPVVTVRAAASAEEAIALLSSHRVTVLPVLDDTDRLVGVISEVDLLTLLLASDPRSHLAYGDTEALIHSRLVKDLMTPDPEVTVEHADVVNVAHQFCRHARKCLPVVRGHEVVGVISRSDVVRALARPDRDVESDVNLRLREDLSSKIHGHVRHGHVEIHGAPSERTAKAAAAVAATSSAFGRSTESLGARPARMVAQSKVPASNGTFGPAG